MTRWVYLLALLLLRAATGLDNPHLATLAVTAVIAATSALELYWRPRLRRRAGLEVLLAAAELRTGVRSTQAWRRLVPALERSGHRLDAYRAARRWAVWDIT